ncbi:TolC family protein [Myxococcus sp. K15C18031901]|uniref:TolC family protein n=1 Tax=Myxococcus dinghuensis TaxID=2906761 RepID=UPI0020A7600F|nr:TolC family protein [Myxococcus dinghuensis]MCP3100869.1 TolC family protein [Myxococcus dinghuensis]
MTAWALGVLGGMAVTGSTWAQEPAVQTSKPADAPVAAPTEPVAPAATVTSEARPATAQPPSEAKAATSVTLEEAILRAMKANPQVAQATGNVTNAEAAERSAVGAYLPNLSASASGALSSSRRIDPETGAVSSGSNDTYAAGLAASWNVFTGGQRGANRKQTQAQTGAAEAQLVAQRANAVLEVQRSFFEVLRAEGLEQVANSRIERAKQNAEAAERRLAVGSATRSDLLRAQLDHTNAREALRTAETQRESATLSLGRLIGEEGPVGARPMADEAPRPIALTPDALLVELEANAPAVLAAAATLKASEAGVSAAKATYLPTVRLSAGYDWFNQDPSFNGGSTSWSVRLGLAYPIFDGFLREERVQRARTSEMVSQAQLADTRRALRSGAAQALAQIRLSADRIGFSEQAVEVAREDLKVQQERYRLGATTILDLLTSQESLVQSEINLVSARFDYRIARAELEALAGRPL